MKIISFCKTEKLEQNFKNSSYHTKWILEFQLSHSKIDYGFTNKRSRYPLGSFLIAKKEDPKAQLCLLALFPDRPPNHFALLNIDRINPLTPGGHKSVNFTVLHVSLNISRCRLLF